MEVSAIERLPGFNAPDFPDEVLGRAYVVPDDRAAAVLAELDFREKGGYSRRVVDVERLDADGSDGPAAGAVVRALLYSGTVDNPNFWWGDGGGGWDADDAAHTIAAAVGPSGPNLEYLSNLAAFLSAFPRHPDRHVAGLWRRVMDITAANKATEEL